METLLILFLSTFVLLLIWAGRMREKELSANKKNPYYFDSYFSVTYENGNTELIQMYKRNMTSLFDIAETRALRLNTRVLKILDAGRNVEIM